MWKNDFYLRITADHVACGIGNDRRVRAGVDTCRVGERKRDTSPEKDLPSGCILARDFARMHGVAPETFRDHIMKGIGRGLEGKDKVEVSERPKPGREKETERYLTPDQQEQARAFWRRHDIAFTRPDETEEEM